MNYFLEALFFVPSMIQFVMVPFNLCVFIYPPGVFNKEHYHIVALAQTIAIGGFFYTGLEFFGSPSAMRVELRRQVKGYSRVIHPFSKMNYFLEALFFVSWMIQFVVVPFNLCVFIYPPGVFNKELSYIVAIAQTIAIGGFFYTGYIEIKTKQIILEKKIIVKHYLKTFCIPDAICVLGPLLHSSTDISFMLGVYALHGVYDLTVSICLLSRAPTIVAHLVDLQRIIGARKIACFIVPHCFVLGLSMHLMTCFVIGTYDGDLPIENVMLFLVAIYGRLYTLYMIADLLKLFGISGMSESIYEQKVYQLDEFMKARNLPPKVRAKVIHYYNCKTQKEYFNEKAIFKTISEYLRNELFIFGARRLIERNHELRQLSTSLLGAMIAEMKSETYLPNEFICKVGLPWKNVYFINFGEVAVKDKYGDELCHLVDGEAFGYMYLAQPEARDACPVDFVVAELSDIYSISRQRFDRFLAEHVDLRRNFEMAAQARLEEFKKWKSQLRGTDLKTELRSKRLLEQQRKRQGMGEVV